MGRTIHLARLESPIDALRCACGAWRERANWTTVPALVTCPECLRVAAERARRPAGAGDVPAPP